MVLSEKNGLQYFHFEELDRLGFKHGFFTRQGGVSPQPWSSLNLGGTNGDSRANVVENRRRIFECTGIPVESILDVWQVHETEILHAEKPRPLDMPHQKADGITCSEKGITLFMRFADCVPILFVDPNRRVIGIAHAGWKGTVKKIAGMMVDHLVSDYQCQPVDIIAAIGPSIGPDHYEVDDDVISRVKHIFGEKSKDLLVKVGEKIHFDLWETNRLILKESGVEKILNASLCTACDTQKWYSHRAEDGKTGRFGAYLAFK